jgi:hypothetical protein
MSDTKKDDNKHDVEEDSLRLRVLDYIKNDKILLCREYSSDGSNPIKIEHELPPGIDINNGDEVFFSKNSKDSYINMKLYNSNNEEIIEMNYIHGYDIFVGEHNLKIDAGNIKVYQVILKRILFGDTWILEISYHDMEQQSGTKISHNGTIHPS